ncbi:hypothetical protein N473_12900 [Pseudoalteromonas luteoviolacea CPMOR-1]|uniref:Uncharacterized protein n=1 Tax=Pseudoalteromonas luteoviolacea CPMOR-1 TaxID=1365248 RepID=A0A162BP08_9GAMM|nr:hypothetical protein [Pseudoalteromonas luteoviolacea]KZN64930.1 hypothetical protein N473_12900 [Pseudoalteromonas luteoviolacea CPMOR-1]
MNNSKQPIDRGRLMCVVDTYQSKELDAKGQPKVKNKYLQVGEATLWNADNGGTFTKVRRLLPAPSYPSEEVIWWDSQEQNNQQGHQQGQQQGHQQNHQQNHQQGYQQGHHQNGY